MDVAAAQKTLNEAKANREAIIKRAKEIGRQAEDQARVDLGLPAADKALHDASSSYVAALDAKPDHEWTGKRVHADRSVGPGYFARKERIFGVVETRRSDTVFPSNAASYSLPAIGEGFVRILKKDGTPGSKFDRMGNWNSWKLCDGE